MEGPAITRIARSVLLAVILTGAILLTACGSSDDALGTVHGSVTDVQERSITEIESFSVRDDTGETWIFTTEGPLEPFPDHLRQHMLIGQQVRVIFENQDASLIAVSILDYP